jgi:hypothetical protein
MQRHDSGVATDMGGAAGEQTDAEAATVLGKLGPDAEAH